MGNWQEIIEKRIEEKLEGANEKDIIFFRIAEFKRNIQRVDNFSSSCQECEQFKKSIEENVQTIDKAINETGKKRREYDKLISNLSKHMQKKHNFYPPYYFSYLFSFGGIIVGVAFGSVLMLFNQQLKLELFLVGFAIVLVPVYFWGASKDKIIRREKRIM